MGIIYRFAMRFLKVKDLDKVDLDVVTSDDDNFDEYLEKAKENRASKLKEVIMNPGSKRQYTVENIAVPEGTQVIAIGNEACDRRGGCDYEITFHYENEKEDYSKNVWDRCGAKQIYDQAQAMQQPPIVSRLCNRF